MKLLVLAHRVPFPPNKGEKIRTFNHLAYLSKQGHHTIVVAPTENKEDTTFAKQFSAKLAIPVVHSKLPAKLIRMAKGLLRGEALSVSNFRNNKIQEEIDTLLDSSTPSIVMCTSSAMAHYVLNSTTLEKIRKNKIRLVMDFMDLDSLKWEQYAKRKPWPISMIYKREAKLLSRVETKILEEFDASLFVSSEEKDLLQTNPKFASKVQVVTNGVDTEAFYPAPDSRNMTEAQSDRLLNGPSLLFTGVMDYFPNEDAVLWFADNVWPKLKEKYPNAKFVVAGMRPSSKIQALANTAGIEITGFVEDILPYYHQADLMVAPFRLARGIQNKILQAMACGLPVVTSTEGATGLDCTPGKHLSVATEPDEYITAIEQLLNDNQRWQTHKQAGLELVSQKYSWDTENAKLESILSGRPTIVKAIPDTAIQKPDTVTSTSKARKKIPQKRLLEWLPSSNS